MAYKDEVPSSGGLDGLPGFHMKKGNYPHQTYFLSDDGRNLGRILPCIQNGVELPLRVNEEQSNFTDWIKAEKLVKMMGVNDRFTCLTRVKGKDRDYRGPIESLIEAMKTALVANVRLFPVEWETWTLGTKDKNGKYTGQGMKIPRPDTFALVQCLLFETGGKEFKNVDGRPKPKFPVLWALSKSARASLQNVCNTQVPGFTGNPEDYNNRYTCGDLISCAHGRLVNFTMHKSTEKTFAGYDV